MCIYSICITYARTTSLYVAHACDQSLRCTQLFVTPRTVACQAPLSMGFSRQEYWSGLPFLPAGDLPHPGIEPWSPTWQADSLPSEPPGKPKLHIYMVGNINDKVKSGKYFSLSWQMACNLPGLFEQNALSLSSQQPKLKLKGGE